MGDEEPEAAPSQEAPADKLPAEEERTVQLPDGEALSGTMAATITRAARARVVVLAGPVASGKTTLVASIYERFQKGPFAGYMFAGSNTLLGFERRCHGARIASENPTAETVRTNPSEGLVYLHLGLRAAQPGSSIRNVLFTDVTGERFRQARDSTEDCMKLSVLKRADHVVMLIDGQRLVSAYERHQATWDIDLLLRSCLDAEMLGAASFVDVVTTKWDVVQPALGLEDNAEYLDRVEKQVLKRYSSRLGRLRLSRVAARPSPESTLAPAFGLDHLLPSWVEEVPDVSTDIEPTEHEIATREFIRFGMKRSG